MNRKFLLIGAIFIVIGAVVGGLFGKLPSTISADNTMTRGRVVADYKEALEVIDQNYGGKIDHERVSESSIQSMLLTLDPHSAFFTRAEFDKLVEEQSSQFYGIGVSILQHRDGVYVQSVIPNTPAAKAGIRYGDRFLKVDGKDAREWTSSDVSKNVRGPRGTAVKLVIDRAASKTPLDFEIVRGGVPLPSIRNYFMLPNGVGYVGLTGGFQETTSQELGEAIGDLESRGMTSLILDVRGNPGGLLPQAIEVVSRFVPEGKTVVSVKGRSRYARTHELKAEGGPVDEFPLIVMVNGGSASASEIVAGAVQDYGRGLVVGTDSFGKGLVQRIFQLPYGTGLTLTTARFYTPFGRSLQRDYSSGSIYEYFTHGQEDGGTEAETDPKPAGSPVTTPDGRVLYGGRGIEPDVEVKADEYTPVRYRISEASFFFVRQLVAGNIAGLEQYRADKQSQKLTIDRDELPITDKMFDAFVKFATADKLNGLSASNIAAEADFAKVRIREELATAHFSNEAGVQVLLESDPQILAAIDLMPRAAEMVRTSIAFNRNE